jgi:O-antigen ligase
MGIPNESHLSRKYEKVITGNLRQGSAKKNNTSINAVFSYAVFINYFVFVLITIYSNSSFEADYAFNLIIILAFSDILMLSFISINYRYLSSLPSFVILVFIWLFWMVTTCLLALKYDASALKYSFVEVLYCPLSFLFFFVLIKSNQTLLSKINIVFLILLAFIFPLFISEYNFRKTLLVDSFSVMDDIYFLILLLPWVLLYPKVLWKSIGILVIILAVLLAMKRTALLALVLALVVYFLSERIRVRKLIDWRFLVGICFFAAIILPLYSYIDTQTNSYLSSRISSSADDEGSGRLDIYKEVIKLQSESTIDSWVIGHGHNTVTRFVSGGFSAHNDWLEVLFDYGLIGIVLYSCFYLLLLRKIFQLLKQRSYYGPPLAASYALFFVISLTSHLVLYASTFAFLMAFWGSIFAMTWRENTLSLQEADHFTHISS